MKRDPQVLLVIVIRTLFTTRIFEKIDGRDLWTGGAGGIPDLARKYGLEAVHRSLLYYVKNSEYFRPPYQGYRA